MTAATRKSCFIQEDEYSQCIRSMGGKVTLPFPCHGACPSGFCRACSESGTLHGGSSSYGTTDALARKRAWNLVPLRPDARSYRPADIEEAVSTRLDGWRRRCTVLQGHCLPRVAKDLMMRRVLLGNTDCWRALVWSPPSHAESVASVLGERRHVTCGQARISLQPQIQCAKPSIHRGR